MIGESLNSFLMVEMPACTLQQPNPIENPCAKPNPILDTTIGINSKLFDVTRITFMSAGCAPTGYIPIVDTVKSKMAYTATTPYGTGRQASGILTDSSVTSVIGSLGLCVNVGSSFAFTNANITACNSADARFISGVVTEFNYYYALYVYAIRNLSVAIQCPGTDTLGSWTAAAAVVEYTKAAIVLNTMVNDIIYIIDQVARKRTTLDVPTLTNKLNLLDQSLTTSSASLQTQRDKLTTMGQDKMILMKDMEAYSRQKAKYHNNMLMLYSFLNITALGLLFYVYRST
jgi:hypothetical protein